MSASGEARVRREVGVGIERLWSVVTDWSRHGKYVPLTTTYGSGEPGVGQVMTAVTKVAGQEFLDPMEVTVWEPPRDGAARVRLEKRGAGLLGWAEITMRSIGDDRTELVWREELHSAAVPTLPGPLRSGERLFARGSTALMVSRIARKLAHEAEAGA